MSRLSFAAIVPVWLASCLLCFAHDGEDHSQVTPEGVAGGLDDGWTSGDGSLRFEVLYTREHLPDQAQAVAENLHGGFGVDRREGHGETYFAAPGAGIIRLSADLGKAAPGAVVRLVVQIRHHHLVAGLEPGPDCVA